MKLHRCERNNDGHNVLQSLGVVKVPRSYIRDADTIIHHLYHGRKASDSVV